VKTREVDRIVPLPIQQQQMKFAKLMLCQLEATTRQREAALVLLPPTSTIIVVLPPLRTQRVAIIELRPLLALGPLLRHSLDPDPRRTALRSPRVRIRHSRALHIRSFLLVCRPAHVNPLATLRATTARAEACNISQGRASESKRSVHKAKRRADDSIAAAAAICFCEARDWYQDEGSGGHETYVRERLFLFADFDRAAGVGCEDLAEVEGDVGAACGAGFFDPFSDGGGEGAVVFEAAFDAGAVEEADLEGAGAACRW
jgi:hypothetical protein